MFTLLCVCTGNICRSPVTERLLADRLGPAITLTSAGTAAPAGAPMAPEMIELLSARGIVADDFVARGLRRPQLQGADLVLTATREHRALAAELFPAAVRRLFTLREFARLVEAVGPERLDQPGLVDRLTAATRLAPRFRDGEPQGERDDISDPYGGSRQDYLIAYAAVADAVDRIAAVVVDRRPVDAVRA